MTRGQVEVELSSDVALVLFEWIGRQVEDGWVRLSDAHSGDPIARAYAEDAERRAGQGRAYVATYIAAVAAEHAGGPEGRDAERAAQAAWFDELLG